MSKAITSIWHDVTQLKYTIEEEVWPVPYEQTYVPGGNHGELESANSLNGMLQLLNYIDTHS